MIRYTVENLMVSLKMHIFILQKVTDQLFRKNFGWLKVSDGGQIHTIHVVALELYLR